jgi:hypothetical protein
VAKTNADLRIGYAAEQIVFNWENNKSELRVDGEPGSGARPGAGQIPTKKDVIIRWLVTPKNQTVFVDGTERFAHEGDYSKLDRLVTVFGITRW